jgi:hypothetical protein
MGSRILQPVDLKYFFDFRRIPIQKQQGHEPQVRENCSFFAYGRTAYRGRDSPARNGGCGLKHVMARTAGKPIHPPEMAGVD